jgi:RHS repeat-associated protein
LQPLQIYYTVGTISSNTLNQLQQANCPTTTATIMSRLYDFGQAGASNNGTVQSITNCRDTNRTQNFLYDSLNRIQQAYTSGSNWGETFTVDAWGNLTNKGPVTGKTNYESLNVAPATIKNQINGFCNDSAGNLVLNTACPSGTFTPTYSYDAENRLISTGGVTYTYDGDGRRVKKSNGMLYWAGSSSDALVETDLSGNATAEYVFFNGRRIARIDQPAGSIEYYYSDHLGSADVITNASGTITKESDYYPYGGEIPIISGDSNHYKFNGKERDTESGLDNFGARYDSSSLGRFMTPDWAARPTAVPYAVFGDPQSLNLYGYVRNDPVSRADLDGHDGAERDAIINQGDVSPFSYGFQMGNGLDTPDFQQPPQQKLDSEAPQRALAGARAASSGSDPHIPMIWAQNTVTVEQVKGQGVNGGPFGFDHAAISVNGQQAVGLEPKKDTGTVVEDKTVPGAVRAVDPNREVKDKATIQVTPEQAAKIQTFLNNAAKNPPNYNLYHSNCAQFCERALQAGGVKNVPNDMTPHGMVEDLKSTPHWTDYIRLVPLPVF